MLVSVELTYVSGSIANKTNSTFKDAPGVTVAVRPDSTWGTIPTLTLTAGDKVVVTGYVNWFNNPQISNVPDYDFIVVAGGELPHEHNFIDGKCECGEEDPNYVPPHVHEECPECGKCLDKECPDGDVCQGHEVAVEGGSVTLTMKDAGAANGWAYQQQIKSVEIDENITMTIAGGTNSGKFYTDQLRVYATDTPAGSITLTAKEGYKIKSVSFGLATGTYAFLQLDGVTIANGQVVELDAASVLFNTVKNGSNGKQVRLLSVTVTYEAE